MLLVELTAENLCCVIDVLDPVDCGSVHLKISFAASATTKESCNISTNEIEGSFLILILKEVSSIECAHYIRI